MFSKTLALALLAAVSVAAPIPAADPAITGSGILLKNAGTLTTEYCFFNNLWNGDGTAGPNFSNPDNCVTLGPNGASQFVPLASTFKGRVQRTKNIPATWVEFQLAASNDNAAHGDVSIEQGSDGPATIESTDGTNQQGGFTNELVPSAPEAATMIRSQDGQKVLASTMGNWLAPANGAAAAFAATLIDPTATYITGGTGVKDVSSKNQAFKVTFY